VSIGVGQPSPPTIVVIGLTGSHSYINNAEINNAEIRKETRLVIDLRERISYAGRGSARSRRSSFRRLQLQLEWLRVFGVNFSSRNADSNGLQLSYAWE
jgi:hypothetical protein